MEGAKGKGKGKLADIEIRASVEKVLPRYPVLEFVFVDKADR